MILSLKPILVCINKCQTLTTFFLNFDFIISNNIVVHVLLVTLNQRLFCLNLTISVKIRPLSTYTGDLYYNFVSADMTNNDHLFK